MLPDALKQMRKRRGVPQSQIAAAIGISTTQYQNYEYGKSEPTASVLTALADFFAVPLDYLAGRGIFAVWDRLMETQNREALFEQLDEDLPELMDKLRLRELDEQALMHVLPAFIDHVEFNDEKDRMTVFYYVK